MTSASTTQTHQNVRSSIFRRVSGAVSAGDADRIEQFLLHSSEFDWYLNNTTIGWEGPTYPAEAEDYGQFTHVFNNGHGTVQNGSAWVMSCFDTPVFNSLIRDCRGTERIKANLLISRGAPVLNPAHYDSLGPALTVLYYVNDSDGDTVFFDRVRGDNYMATMQPVAWATPRKGDCLIFDSAVYHASSHPVAVNQRAVINFVFNL